MKKKVALLIYCDDYISLSKLKYTKSDVTHLNEKLKSFGFITKIISNYCECDIPGILDEIDSYIKNEVDEFVFYYSGHGGEEKGESYLCHKDFNPLANSNEVLYSSLKISDLFQSIKMLPGNKIIIFDACRNSIGKGINGSNIAIQNYPENSIICFASSPGQVSLEDDVTKHGFYTGTLLEYIDKPNYPIELLLKKVAQVVAAKTFKKQIPWYHTSLLNDVYFNEELFSTCNYEQNALADSRYRVDSDSKIGWIIKDLKTHDYNKQNAAINAFEEFNIFDSLNKNDLFVLGRNICQSASGGGYASSYDCIRFINNFESFVAPLDVKTHLLNGMAFEMYFDKNGKMRDRFKSSRKESIISLLEETIFSESRCFIRSQLANYNNRVIYMPGSGFITIDIDLSLNNENEITSIIYKDQKCIFNEFDFPTRLIAMSELKKEIEEAVCAPRNAVQLILNKEVTAETTANCPRIVSISLVDN